MNICNEYKRRSHVRLKLVALYVCELLNTTGRDMKREHRPQNSN